MTTKAYSDGYAAGLAGTSFTHPTRRIGRFAATNTDYAGRDEGLWRRGYWRGSKHRTHDAAGVLRAGDIPYDMEIIA